MGILDRLLGREQEKSAEESSSMHAVLITFTSSASLDDLKAPFTDYANALRGVEGLVSKTWIREGSTVGGFHIFTSRQAEGDCSRAPPNFSRSWSRVSFMPCS